MHWKTNAQAPHTHNIHWLQTQSPVTPKGSNNQVSRSIRRLGAICIASPAVEKPIAALQGESGVSTDMCASRIDWAQLKPSQQCGRCTTAYSTQESACTITHIHIKQVAYPRNTYWNHKDVIDYTTRRLWHYLIAGEVQMKHIEREAPRKTETYTVSSYVSLHFAVDPQLIHT